MRIIPYVPRHRQAFEQLNMAWITAHWEPEPADFKVLRHPEEHILKPGGYIAMAIDGEEVVGTCALIKMDARCYELAKMAVAQSARGQGVGWALANDVIEKARSLGASRVYLESNTILAPAIALYRKLGFNEVMAPPSPYRRANIQMELRLLDEARGG